MTDAFTVPVALPGAAEAELLDRDRSRDGVQSRSGVRAQDAPVNTARALDPEYDGRHIKRGYDYADRDDLEHNHGYGRPGYGDRGYPDSSLDNYTEEMQRKQQKLALGANAAAIIASDTVGLASCGMNAGPVGMGMGVLQGLLIGGIEASNATRNLNAQNRRPRFVYGSVADDETGFSVMVVLTLLGLAGTAVACARYGSLTNDGKAIRRDTVYLDAYENPDADDYNHYKTLMKNR
ncbi:putative transmembrane protein [Gregarina niphandrodes]|uniref:Transmembrane protein n=1 Tax=Gregarina niphandrodes TaxID=110365 RepID=A0A023B1E2_GRENI|nr:putative transmembrane protein [Gregarina niphandrodes]EZG45807.1 putative transmembrane protein [Gregarina niphandrodes]|eukprot:XP_011132444.1 putative transmembrane protein [Gregarina niphandrodes]